MKIIGMLLLLFTFHSQSKEINSVYCNNFENEYQYKSNIQNIVAKAHHRNGFLSIETKLIENNIKKILLKNTESLINSSDCIEIINVVSNSDYGNTLIARFNFDFDQSKLSSLGKSTLIELADSLIKRNDLLIIDGHTDSIGTYEYNNKLGYSRALATATMLTSEGVEDKKIMLKSFGETQPVMPNSSEFGRAKNRRVELWLNN